MTAKLKFARRVTAKHGERFAEEWFAESFATLAIVKAFGATRLMTWPDDAEAQERFKDIEDEILERTFAVSKGAIGEAFVDAAREVLARERLADVGGQGVEMAETKLLDVYREVAYLTRQVRLMDRFFEEVVDAKPETRAFLSDLHDAYMSMLNQELAPHALLLAVAVTQLEDAYPEIGRAEAPERATAT